MLFSTRILRKNRPQNIVTEKRVCNRRHYDILQSIEIMVMMMRETFFLSFLLFPPKINKLFILKFFSFDHFLTTFFLFKLKKTTKQKNIIFFFPPFLTFPLSFSSFLLCFFFYIYLYYI